MIKKIFKFMYRNHREIYLVSQLAVLLMLYYIFKSGV